MRRLLSSYRPVLEYACVRATALLFFVNGFVFANWVVRLPAVKDALSLGEAALGVALLFYAIGGIVAMPLGGALVSRFGSARVAVISGSLFAALFVLPPTAHDIVTLSAALVVVGLMNGAMDVSMNAQASAIEARFRVRIMSFCHAMFSLGLTLGALPAGVFASAGVSPSIHLAIVGAVGAAAALTCSRFLVADPERAEPGPAFAIPRGPLLWLGLICLSGAIVEGAMNDWLTVFVEQELGRSPAAAAFAFGVFAGAMLIGRLVGDVVTDRFGAVAPVRYGLIAAAVGLLLATSGHGAGLIAGFVLVGLGIAGIFPAVFRTAGQLPGRPPGPSMAAAVTLGYGGFLLGPPVIGFVAEATSLGFALALLAPLCLIGAMLSGALRAGEPQSALPSRT